jgi:hypothetical protein
MGSIAPVRNPVTDARRNTTRRRFIIGRASRATPVTFRQFTRPTACDINKF